MLKQLPDKFKNELVASRPSRHWLASVLGWLLLDIFYPKPKMWGVEVEGGRVYKFVARRFGESYTTYATDLAVVGICRAFSLMSQKNEDLSKMLLGFSLIHPEHGGFTVPSWAVSEFLNSIVLVGAQEAAHLALQRARAKQEEDEQEKTDAKPTLH